jgi:hypothetical protein
MKSLFQQSSRFYSPAGVQQADQVVDISDWSLGGDFNPYAEGTRAKFELRCPADVTLPFLIPEHRYLYKKTIQRQNKTTGALGYIHYEQFWVEIVAYKLGQALGVDVPPAFVACRTLPDSGEKEYACLIEWYYGFPNAPHGMVSRGGELMLFYYDGDYDREKGEQHNFQAVRDSLIELGVTDWLVSLTKILLFDAILGNTDRHQENWEVVSHFDSAAMLVTHLSPAFDNGTALGYQILPEKLTMQMQNIATYIARGTHHLKWRREDAKQAGHFELLNLLVAEYPETKAVMAKILACDITGLCEDIGQLCRFDIQNPHYCLTQQRAEFMIALLRTRFQKAKETLGL